MQKINFKDAIKTSYNIARKYILNGNFQEIIQKGSDCVKCKLKGWKKCVYLVCLFLIPLTINCIKFVSMFYVRFYVVSLFF